MTLATTPLYKLRAIAQGYGIPDIFQKTDVQLRQAIELKQNEVVPKISPAQVAAPYDARLMTKPPSKRSTKHELLVMLQPLVDLGLVVTFPNEEEWHMRMGKKEDTGTMRQPLRNVLECANRLVK